MLLGALGWLRRHRGDRQPVDRRARRRARRGAVEPACTRSSWSRRGCQPVRERAHALFLALGVTSLFGVSYVGSRSTPSPRGPCPGCRDIPGLGPILFDHDPLVYVALLRGPGDLVGAVPHARRPAGADRGRAHEGLADRPRLQRQGAWRYGASIVGGAWRASAARSSSIAYANAWFENMIAGRGFIAVALVIFAVWNPIRVMAGAYLFGAALALAPVLQARGYAVNQFALDAVPVRAHARRPRPSSAPHDAGRAGGALKVFENAPAARTCPTTLRRPRTPTLPSERTQAMNACSRHSPRRRRRGVPGGARRVQPRRARPPRLRRSARRPGPPQHGAPGKGATTVGFIIVGPKDDFGYNQAVYEGGEAVGRSSPTSRCSPRRTSPRTTPPRTTWRDDRQGRQDHLRDELRPPRRRQEGRGRAPRRRRRPAGQHVIDAVPANIGTYFGTVYEPVYLAGIAAGAATKTNKLGYVYAFPIPQTMANINAFELGAKTVQPRRRRRTRSTPRAGATRASRPTRAESLLARAST